MSALHKSIMKNKLPPKMPRTSGVSKLAPFGAARRKDYRPVSWKNYFEKYVDVDTEAGMFRVYLSPEPDQPGRLRIITLHGGGYSGLSWSLFTENVLEYSHIMCSYFRYLAWLEIYDENNSKEEITNMIDCQVVSMDIRGHGETKVEDPEDLSIETLVNDVGRVLHKLWGVELPPLLLLGHSMGGAVAVRAAHTPSLEPHVEGVAVIDVVEGTAMDALASMQSFLRSRPTHFRSIEHAVEWCVRSGQVRNVESARVSMPGQIVNCDTGELATGEVDGYEGEAPEAPRPTARGSRPDVIAEEGETEEAAQGPEGDAASFVEPRETAMRYSWRVELARSERHWAGWFAGLSAAFLATRAPRLLLLASLDGLDRALTVGQMQGKFQMQVLTRCGHAVHEDSPAEVARVLAAFAARHRLASARDAAPRPGGAPRARDAAAPAR